MPPFFNQEVFNSPAQAQAFRCSLDLSDHHLWACQPLPAVKTEVMPRFLYYSPPLTDGMIFWRYKKIVADILYSKQSVICMLYVCHAWPWEVLLF